MTTLEIFLNVMGYIGAILTVSIYIPQFIKTLKTRDTAGVSLLMYIILQITAVTWIIYGILSSISVSNTFATNSLEFAAVLPIPITNFLVGILGAAIFKIKLSNLIGAKKHNISEREYIDLTLKKKSSVKNTN